MAKAALPGFVGRAVRAHAGYANALLWWEHWVGAAPGRYFEFLLAQDIESLLASAHRKKGKDGFPKESTLREKLDRKKYGALKANVLRRQTRIALRLGELLETIGATPLLAVDFPASGIHAPALPDSLRAELGNRVLTPSGAGLHDIPAKPLTVQNPGREWLLQGPASDAVFLLRKETRPPSPPSVQSKTVLAVYAAGFQRQFARLPFARQAELAALLSAHLRETAMGVVTLTKGADDPRSPFNLGARLSPRTVKHGDTVDGADGRGIFTISESDRRRYFRGDGRVKIPPRGAEREGPEGKELVEVADKLTECLERGAEQLAQLAARGDLRRVAVLARAVFPKFVPGAELQPLLDRLETNPDLPAVRKLANAIASSLKDGADVAEVLAHRISLVLGILSGISGAIGLVEDPRAKNVAPFIKGLVEAGKGVDDIVKALQGGGWISDDVAKALTLDVATKTIFSLFLGTYGVFQDVEKLNAAFEADNVGQMAAADVMTGASTAGLAFGVSSLWGGAELDAAGALVFAGPVGWIAVGLLAIWTAAMIAYLLLQDTPLEDFLAHCFFGANWDHGRTLSHDPAKVEFRWVANWMTANSTTTRTTVWTRAARPNFGRQASDLMGLLTNTQFEAKEEDRFKIPAVGRKVTLTLKAPAYPVDLLRSLRVAFMGYAADGTRMWHSEVPIPLFDVYEMENFAEKNPWMLNGNAKDATGHCYLWIKDTGRKTGNDLALPGEAEYLEAVLPLPGIPADLFESASRKPDRLEDMPVIRVRSEVRSG